MRNVKAGDIYYDIMFDEINLIEAETSNDLYCEFLYSCDDSLKLYGLCEWYILNSMVYIGKLQ